jgi:hypothetical protein
MWVVTSSKPASVAVRGPDMRRPRRMSRSTEPRAAKTEGNRAVNAETDPNGNEKRAISQKKRGGLWVVISPFSCGTIHSPSTIISRAPSAK